MGIRLRQAPSGKILEGTAPGQILVWNHTTKEWEPGVGGGGSTVDFLWMSPVIGTYTVPLAVEPNGTMTEVTALDTDFTLTAPGTWSLGPDGLLTYTGPDIQCVVSAACTFESSAPFRVGYIGFAICLNDDLLGGNVFDLVNAQAGRIFTTSTGIGSGGGDLDTPVGLSTIRQMNLTSGDTIRPCWGNQNTAGAIDCVLAAFTLSAIYKAL